MADNLRRSQIKLNNYIQYMLTNFEWFIDDNTHQVYTFKTDTNRPASQQEVIEHLMPHPPTQEQLDEIKKYYYIKYIDPITCEIMRKQSLNYPQNDIQQLIQQRQLKLEEINNIDYEELYYAQFIPNNFQ